MPRGSLPLVEVVYFLYRRALDHSAGLGAGSREVFLQSLLSAPLSVAERMCRPALRVLLPPARRPAGAHPSTGDLSGPALELSPAPAVDLALLLAVAAVVDCGTVVYVWLGQGAEGLNEPRIEEACTQAAQRTACSRAPEADVVVVRHGSPGQATALGRLVPISGDEPDMRLRQLPMLPSFSQDEVTCAVDEAGTGPDVKTMCQWLRAHAMLLPPAALAT